MKKQTAVEWLQEPLEHILTHEQQMQVIGLFQQAKAMEKDQILEAYREGRTDQQSGMEKFHNRSSASYYNQNYGS
jgi:hypothetical protein